METAIILLSVAVTTLFLLVGTLLGWLVKDYLDQTRMPFIHPEMFDENGNIIPDEILSVRFENDFISEDEEND
tara:strand:- start:94 stop:312 length:219 start_codon:yes stop_codon:yes gene_type:complete